MKTKSFAMPLWRALFIAGGVSAASVTATAKPAESSQPGPASKVLLSQYGYNPEHRKIVNSTSKADRFVIKKAGDDAVAYSGSLRQVTGDFGSFWQGDFSEFRADGDYYIQIGTDRSPGTFAIRPRLWDNLQKYSAWYYFGLRRVGEDNVMGNLGDYRLAGWEHGRIASPEADTYKYIGRAWGDGDDGRVYPSVSLVVAQYCELKETKPFWDRNDWIYSQVRWGLDGTLSFLEKDGILRLMLAAFPDFGRKSFDNKFYSGDEKLIGNCFDGTFTSNEYNGNNAEVVYSSLLIGAAHATALFRERDPEFFNRVEALVKRGYETIRSQYDPYPKKYSLGSWIWLNSVMWKMTGETVYRDRAVAEADRLLELQQTQAVGDDSFSVRGWFNKEAKAPQNPWGEKPEQEVMITPWIYQGLFKLIEYFPSHPKAEAWRSSVRMYARDYLLAFSGQNPFGYTPMKVEASGQSILKRHRGSVSYQYFASIGRHFHQIGNAAFMLQAGKLLQDSDLVDAAWQQMFWFAGNNPAGLGLIYGIGKNNQPQQYGPNTLGRAFPGGSDNGAIGDENDAPNFQKYHEYYTYANLNVLWFSTVAGAERFENPLELWPKEISEAPHARGPKSGNPASFPLRLKGGFTYPFMAIVRDDPENGIDWYVNDIKSGNGQLGTITDSGAYSAPYTTEEKALTIKAVSRKNPAIQDQTKISIAPVPRRVEDLKSVVANGKVVLSWKPVGENVTGYTVWKRLPVGKKKVGTIFEMVGATKPEQTNYTYPNERIHYYEDGITPAGTEFIVKAYHMTPERIYGFGLPSNKATVPTTASGRTDAQPPRR